VPLFREPVVSMEPFAPAGSRGRSLLRPLRPVLRSTLAPVLDADRVQRTAHDVIADAGKILDASAADQHDRMLLKIVSDSGNVGGDLDAVGEPNARHLAQRRIRLL